ncbi:MAG: hypothetical protein ABIH09_02665 [Candidatus Omnitrophota bacterium]
MREKIFDRKELLREALEFFNDVLAVKDSLNDDTSRRLAKGLEQYAFFAFFHMWKAWKSFGNEDKEKQFLRKVVDDFLECIYLIKELRVKVNFGALASIALKTKVERMLIILTKNSD